VSELVEEDEEMDLSVDREFAGVGVFEPVVWAEFGGDCRSMLFLELPVFPKELCSFLKGFEKGEERRVTKGCDRLLWWVLESVWKCIEGGMLLLLWPVTGGEEVIEAM